jgi:hypothetical protein
VQVPSRKIAQQFQRFAAAQLDAAELETPGAAQLRVVELRQDEGAR